MKQYKHYSFDLWLTLIKSNPEYKKKRAEFFHKRFNPDHLSVGHVDQIIRREDKICDLVNQKVGKSIDAHEIYAKILLDLGNTLDDINLSRMESFMNELVYNYPPVLFDDSTASVLQKIKDQGSTISLLSNTAFIKGSMLRKLLIDLDIAKYFDFQLYSDEVNLSKPNQAFFNIAWGHMRPGEQIWKSEVLHVGDNPIADIKGALDFGFNAICINSNSNTIKDVIPVILSQ